MKTVRNLTFLVLVAVIFEMREGSLLASYTPTFYNCSIGCTCTVDYDNWGHVTAECPEVAGSEECSYGFSACDYYCAVTLPMFIGGYPEPPVCWMTNFGGEGCTPAVGLEPPTNWYCQCACSPW
jgi:hypothetical protein